jgi:MoxR-like ATPase
VGYPDARQEVEMLRPRAGRTEVRRRLLPEEVAATRRLIRDEVHADDKNLEYVVRLGRATREPAALGLHDVQELVLLGLSPRSYQHLLALARVTAFLHGRDHVRPGDVKEVFPDVARHRITRTVRAEAEGISVDHVVQRVADAVPIP